MHFLMCIYSVFFENNMIKTTIIILPLRMLKNRISFTLILDLNFPHVFIIYILFNLNTHLISNI